MSASEVSPTKFNGPYFQATKYKITAWTLFLPDFTDIWSWGKGNFCPLKGYKHILTIYFIQPRFICVSSWALQQTRYL